MDLASKTRSVRFGRVALVGATAALAIGSLSPAVANNVDPLGGNSGTATTAPTTSTFEQDYQNYQNQQNSGNTGNYDKYDVEGNKSDLQQVVEETQFADVESAQNNFIIVAITKFTGWCLNLIIALVFMRLLVFDLAYITLPFLRPKLADANEDGQGNSIPQMGGGGTAKKRSWLNVNWVSDVAIHAVRKGGGAAQAQGNQGGMGGGFGGGGFGGGFGGGGFGGGFGGPQQAEQEEEKKFSVFGYWLRESVKEMVFLGITIAVFTTTYLLSGGMTLGVWLMSLIMNLLGLLPDPGALVN